MTMFPLEPRKEVQISDELDLSKDTESIRGGIYPLCQQELENRYRSLRDRSDKSSL
jgi:hypothetical protein